MNNVKCDENVVTGNEMLDNTIIIKLKNEKDDLDGNAPQPLSLLLSPPAATPSGDAPPSGDDTGNDGGCNTRRDRR